MKRRTNKQEVIRSMNFSMRSHHYSRRASNVDKIISGHSYFTSAPVETLKSVRQKTSILEDASVPLEFWQSEYCILG